MYINQAKFCGNKIVLTFKCHEEKLYLIKEWFHRLLSGR